MSFQPNKIPRRCEHCKNDNVKYNYLKKKWHCDVCGKWSKDLRDF